MLQRNRTDYHAVTAGCETIIRKESSTASGRIENQNSIRPFCVEDKETEKILKKWRIRVPGLQMSVRLLGLFCEDVDISTVMDYNIVHNRTNLRGITMSEHNMYLEQLNRYYAVWRENNLVYEEWAKAHGLSETGLWVLRAIYYDKESCTQKKISEQWVIPKQTVNMILKDFEKKGFVSFIPVQEDRRNKKIFLTDAGKKYADSVISELKELELAVIGEMGIERIKQINDNTSLFVELFRKLRGKNK